MSTMNVSDKLNNSKVVLIFMFYTFDIVFSNQNLLKNEKNKKK